MSLDWLDTLTRLLKDRDDAWRAGDTARAAEITAQIRPLTAKLEALKEDMLASSQKSASSSSSSRSKWKWRRG